MARVLIIDDEEDVRDAVRLTLERAGHAVVVAARGDAGILMHRDNAADVIIIDIVMPGQNGVDTIRELRNGSPDTRIIAISGGGNLGPAGYQPGAIKTAAYLAAAQAAGADLTYTKPFDRQELLDAIAALASSKH
jgi:DNA-binding response OmpR family regulator